VVVRVQATVVPLFVASPSAAHIRSDLGIRLPHLPLSVRSAGATNVSPTFRIIEPWSTGSRAEVSESLPTGQAPSAGRRRPRARRRRARETRSAPLRRLLLVPALDPRLLQQLAVLLLRHPLAALLDD